VFNKKWREGGKEDNPFSPFKGEPIMNNGKSTKFNSP